MLSFLKKIFCAAEPTETPAPYKVEAPAPKKAAKKPAVKKATARKPRSPKV
jgi:hypothetical protein